MGYSELSKAFKSDPTIQNYVRLRRQHPTEVVEIAISGALEWLFANEDTLAQVNISPNLVASVLDADEQAISELSLLLMERLIERDDAERAGATHLISRGQAIS